MHFKQTYLVSHENGSMHVFADSEEEAVDAFYESIESVIGHHLKICGCFGPKKPLDRSKIVRIIKIEKVN